MRIRNYLGRFCGGAIALALLLSPVAQAQIDPEGEFRRPRFATNARGNIRIFGNALLTCDIAEANCAAAQAGGVFGNNEFDMVYVDVDGDPSTFNSSEANIRLREDGANSILWAGLYWGGDTSSGELSSPSPPRDSIGQVRFKTPISGGYIDLIADQTLQFDADDSSPGSDGIRYQSFKDVTELVQQVAQEQQSGGEGSYSVANVPSGTGLTSGGLYADWSLVVVFGNPNESLRNLTVFDGLREVKSDATLPVTVSGFVTPETGEFRARIGAVIYEGDRNITGDSLLLNGRPIPENAASSPNDNFFDSSIFGLGTENRNPNFDNQLGFDIVQISLNESSNEILGQGASQATATFTTEGDAFLPGVIVFAIDTLRPDLKASKQATDLNGSTLVPGDLLEYEITVSNPGDDPAANVVLEDAELPNNTTYVPGSLEIVSGAGAGPQTDAAGDDLAEIDLTTNRITFRLGNGATNLTGGTLAPADGQTPGDSATVRFRLRVNDDTPIDTVLSNQAVVNFQGGSTTTDFTETTDGDPTTPGNQPTTVVVGPDAPGIALFKRITAITRASGEQQRFDAVTDDAPDSAIQGESRLTEELTSGDEVEYTIYYRVSGDQPVTDVQLCDLLPEAVTYLPGTLQLQRPGTGAPTPLTDAADGDPASLIAPLTPLTSPCLETIHDNDSLRVDVGDVSNQAGNNLGFVRFRARLN